MIAEVTIIVVIISCMLSVVIYFGCATYETEEDYYEEMKD
jgi:hypothetical protein